MCIRFLTATLVVLCGSSLVSAQGPFSWNPLNPLSPLNPLNPGAMAGKFIAKKIIGEPEEVPTKMELVKVSLDAKIKEVETAHEELSVVPGVKRKLRRSRTVDCSISEVRRLSAEAGVKLDFQLVSAGLRGRVETELGKTVRTSETVEEEFEIDGDKVQRVRLVWCDQYRIGVAAVRINGVVQDVSFEFRIGTKLDIRPSK